MPEEELCRKKEEMARKTAEGEATMVEKEVAKTKRLREKRKFEIAKNHVRKDPE